MNVRYIALFLILAAMGCTESEGTSEHIVQDTVPDRTEAAQTCDNFNEDKSAFFGDVHVHTSYSFDAAANSTNATPADAHRFARGETVPFFPLDESGTPIGEISIDRPLDFLAVTDHGEFLGEHALCRLESSASYQSAFCQRYRTNERLATSMLSNVITSEAPTRLPELCGEDGQVCLDFAKSPWADVQAAANEFNEPCEFTSFIAYEYTGTPGGSNYHRNVIFRGETVPSLPVSYVDAPMDSLLWSSLDRVCRQEDGCDYLTIPHNTNLANGRMAPYMGCPTTWQANERMPPLASGVSPFWRYSSTKARQNVSTD